MFYNLEASLPLLNNLKLKAHLTYPNDLDTKYNTDLDFENVLGQETMSYIR